MQRRLLVCGALLILAGAACRSQVPAPVGPTVSAKPPPAPVTKDEDRPSQKDMLDDLAILATRTPPSGEVAKRRDDVIAGRLSLEGYVDYLLSTPEFGDEVVSRMVGRRLVGIHPSFLEELVEGKTADGKTALTLRGRKMCDSKSIENVHPWWAMDTVVPVCASAHRPNLLQKDGLYCNSRQLNLLNTESPCGCGPNLVQCAPEAIVDKTEASLAAELMRTVGYVVRAGRPIDDVFTMNESVRDDWVEALYQRSRVVTGEIKSLPPLSFTSEAKLRPRYESAPGEHAGILTMSAALFQDAPRARMRDIFHVMWCTPRQSVKVNAEIIFGLGVTNLREGDGWKKLASMPVCTDCHARLDYGMQFFSGWVSHYVGHNVFDAKRQQNGKGLLYGNDIDDRIGEAALTPRDFGKLAVSRPAFSSCMVSNVSEHVFAGTSTADDEAALHAAFQQGHRMADVMRVALLRYARTPRRATGSTANAKPLRAQLLESCGACHTDGSKDFLNQKELSRELLFDILEKVSFGEMPPVEPLSTEKRDALVGSVIGTLFVDPGDRARALEYYNSSPTRVRDPEAVRTLVHGRAGTSPGSVENRWNDFLAYYEEAHEMTYTPELATAIAYEAVKQCEHKGGTPEQVRKCVEEVTAANGIISGHAVHRSR